MTTAFTAIPMKITMSTMRFFFGSCMVDLFASRGDCTGGVYLKPGGKSIGTGQNRWIIRGLTDGG